MKILQRLLELLGYRGDESQRRCVSVAVAEAASWLHLAEPRRSVGYGLGSGQEIVVGILPCPNHGH